MAIAVHFVCKHVHYQVVQYYYYLSLTKDLLYQLRDYHYTGATYAQIVSTGVRRFEMQPENTVSSRFLNVHDWQVDMWQWPWSFR